MKDQTYYHFLSSEYAIKDLKKEHIKISLINKLNDPFELLPYLKYGDFKKRQLYHDIRRKVSKEYGLLCFSKDWRNPLLWGHYADKHKGVAIGFKILNNEIPFEVQYSSVRKRIKFELTDNEEKNKKLFLNLAKTKSKDWFYEREYRMLIKLDDRDEDKSFYFMNFADRLKVDEIILGCEFNKEKRKIIIGLAKSLDVNKNKVIHARQSWKEYKINKCGTKTDELKIMYSQK